MYWMIVCQFDHLRAWWRARRWNRAIERAQLAQLQRAESDADRVAQQIAHLSTMGELRARTVAETLAKAEQQRVDELLAPWLRYFDESEI